MTADGSLLDKVASTVDKAVGPGLQSVVRHEAVGLVFAVVVRLQRGLEQRAERASRHLLHFLNLPAGSDVRRLLAQMALIEREVRELGKAVTDEPPVTGVGRAQR